MKDCLLTPGGRAKGADGEVERAEGAEGVGDPAPATGRGVSVGLGELGVKVVDLGDGDVGECALANAGDEPVTPTAALNPELSFVNLDGRRASRAAALTAPCACADSGLLAADTEEGERLSSSARAFESMLPLSTMTYCESESESSCGGAVGSEGGKANEGEGEGDGEAACSVVAGRVVDAFVGVAELDSPLDSMYLGGNLGRGGIGGRGGGA